jgi:hypothetical protein
VTDNAGSRPHRAPSIALRMTIWYTLSAFALIFVATGIRPRPSSPRSARSTAKNGGHRAFREAVPDVGRARCGGKCAYPPQFMQAAMDREHDEYLLARYREQLWLVLSVSLLLCSLAGYLIARSGMRPIENIGHAAARMRSTTLHERIETRGLPAELAGCPRLSTACSTDLSSHSNTFHNFPTMSRISFGRRSTTCAAKLKSH